MRSRGIEGKKKAVIRHWAEAAAMGKEPIAAALLPMIDLCAASRGSEYCSATIEIPVNSLTRKTANVINADLATNDSNLYAVFAVAECHALQGFLMVGEQSPKAGEQIKQRAELSG